MGLLADPRQCSSQPPPALNPASSGPFVRGEPTLRTFGTTFVAIRAKLELRNPFESGAICPISQEIGPKGVS